MDVTSMEASLEQGRTRYPSTDGVLRISFRVQPLTQRFEYWAEQRKGESYLYDREEAGRQTKRPDD